MRIFESRPALRWLVPVALVGVVGGSSLLAVTATAEPALPEQTAKQLLVDVQQVKIENLQGTVVQTSDLGLPELPGMDSSGDSSLTSLISGTHTLKVWMSGEDKTRLAILGTFGETDIIHNGKDVWTWSSDDNSATHRTLTADERATTKPPVPSDAPTTPQEAAEKVLAAIEPSTEVTTDRNVTVAKRAAYELVLAPRTTESLIKQVRIAVDGATHVPLRVQVFAKDADPVFEVAFSSVDFTAPDAANFRFNPREGVKVTEVPAATADHHQPSDQPDKTGKPSAADQPTIVGEGWATIVISKFDAASLTPSKPGSDRENGQSLARILNSLPKVSGDWGSGHLLSGRAFSAVITDDGRIAVGAVTAQSLFSALEK